MTSSWEPKDHVPKQILDLLKPANTDAKHYNYITVFYQIVSLLKQKKRTGWLDKKIPDPESIADHMYRMSLIAMSLDAGSLEKDEKKPDLSLCVKIALVHDIAESLVGDITPKDPTVGKAEKHDREYKTIKYLSSIVEPYNPKYAEELTNLWLDYEYQRNPEGSIVKDIDKYELLIQTFEYERLHNRKLDEFYSCRAVIKHKEIQNLADKLLHDREVFFAAK